jgi:hypothetical protein
MEFHVTMPDVIDPGAIEQAIRAVDPAALVDIDPAGPALRVAAMIDIDQLIALFNQAGHAVRRDQVAQAPSVCCGGCGG